MCALMWRHWVIVILDEIHKKCTLCGTINEQILGKDYKYGIEVNLPVQRVLWDWVDVVHGYRTDRPQVVVMMPRQL
jgi:hypothetical protein